MVKKQNGSYEDAYKSICSRCDFHDSFKIKCSCGLIQGRAKCKRFYVDGANI